MRILVILISVVFSFNAFGQFKQYNTKKKKKDFGDYIQPFEYKGWFIEPGVTYTPSWHFIKYEPQTEFSIGDTTFSLQYTPKPLMGFYFGVGRYHMISSRKLLNYIDYSLAFKQLKGYEQTNGEMSIAGVHGAPTPINSEGTFTDNFVVANFNANVVKSFNDWFFIQNSLGINVDYSFSRKTSYTYQDGGDFVLPTHQSPKKIIASLHYKFGLGFRVSKRLILIPMVETPILNGYEFEKGRSTLPYFSSRYRPLIFTLRIGLLKDPKCPRVWGGPDAKKASEQHLQK